MGNAARNLIIAPEELALFDALPKIPSKSWFRPAASSVPYKPGTPNIAAAYGYNNLLMFDDFNNLGTIDINNTLNPGYNWYVQYLQTNASGQQKWVLNPGAVTAYTDTVIKIQQSAASSTPNLTGGYLTNMGIKGNFGSTSLVGTAINPNGCYMEAAIAYNNSDITSNYQSNINYTGAFWLFDNTLTLTGNNNLSFPLNGLAEVDVMEIFYDGSGSPFIPMNDWTWYNNNGNYGSSYINNTNTNSGLTPGDGNMHKYGMLWVPQSKNGGTGLIKRYFDGVEVSACAVTYTSSGISPQENGSVVGWMSCLENMSGLGLQIGPGLSGAPMYVDYVGVWA